MGPPPQALCFKGVEDRMQMDRVLQKYRLIDPDKCHNCRKKSDAQRIKISMRTDWWREGCYRNYTEEDDEDHD